VIRRYLQYQPAFSYLGRHRYSLTFGTAHRRRVFVEQAPVDVVRAQILRAAEQRLFAILAYCFMPDHLHLLVEGLLEES
jgi:putative transposase